MSFAQKTKIKNEKTVNVRFLALRKNALSENALMKRLKLPG